MMSAQVVHDDHARPHELQRHFFQFAAATRAADQHCKLSHQLQLDVLAIAHPAAFGRASRLKRLALSFSEDVISTVRELPHHSCPMTTERNPQAEQMADESMLRTLAAQAEAIWPQEQYLLERYGMPVCIADIGCGSGEITSRLAARYPQAQIIGVDILESSAAYARQRHAALAPRVTFEQGDAFGLRFPDSHFDLVVCRHMTQSVPEPEKVLAELERICKPGGWIHVLSEDYGMLNMPTGDVDPDRLWHEGVIAFTHSTHTDARIGRRTWTLMNQLGLRDLHVDYVIVDTLRVPRQTFGTIIQAWRDGYTDVIAEHTRLTRAEVRTLFDHVIATILDPEQYAVWHIPIVSGRKPVSGQRLSSGAHPPV